MINNRTLIMAIVFFALVFAMASAQFGPYMGPRYAVGGPLMGPGYMVPAPQPIYKGPFGGMAPMGMGPAQPIYKGPFGGMAPMGMGPYAGPYGR